MIIDANDAAAHFIGYPDRESLLAQPISLVDRYVNIQDRAEMLSAVATHGRIHNFETRFRKNDGTIIWIRASAILVPEKGWMEGVAEDITERKRVEEALRESEERHRVLLDENSDPFFSFTAEGHYTFVNRAFARGVGKQVDQIVGKTIWDVFPKDEADKRFAALSQVFRTGEEKVIEVRVPRPEGDSFYITTITPVKNSQGPILTVICSSKDITERKRMEEELLKSRKLESVGILAGGIAHDFNNLLATISGYIEMTKDDLPQESPVQEYMLAAGQAAHQAAELTKRLITFSQGGGPVRKPCNIGALIKDTVYKEKVDKKVEVKFIIADNLREAEVDEGQIRQVIKNIAGNAAEAMPDGGVLTVSAENVTVSGPNQLPVSEGAYVRIAFTDTGTGISGHDLPFIFDPYFSTKQRGQQRGMGLGLSVCHSIVNKHLGAITAETKPGIGSTFYVYLPAINKKTAA
jgi:PAS domain S-box-containing protein